VKKYILILVSVFVIFGCVYSQEIIELSPQEAYELANQPSSYIIDVRSIAEYVFIGHPEMAFNIPFSFWNEELQKLVPNADFIADIKASFKKDDVLIFLCRSGGRSLNAAKKIVETGFTRVHNLTQGFEGKKDENGYRTIGGWKNSGVSYTYNLNKELVYNSK
jgi:rhodanese-related sulfurtransferase